MQTVANLDRTFPWYHDELVVDLPHANLRQVIKIEEESQPVKGSQYSGVIFGKDEDGNELYWQAQCISANDARYMFSFKRETTPDEAYRMGLKGIQQATETRRSGDIELATRYFNNVFSLFKLAANHGHGPAAWEAAQFAKVILKEIGISYHYTKKAAFLGVADARIEAAFSRLSGGSTYDLTEAQAREILAQYRNSPNSEIRQKIAAFEGNITRDEMIAVNLGEEHYFMHPAEIIAYTQGLEALETILIRATKRASTAVEVHLTVEGGTLERKESENDLATLLTPNEIKEMRSVLARMPKPHSETGIQVTPPKWLDLEQFLNSKIARQPISPPISELARIIPLAKTPEGEYYGILSLMTKSTSFYETARIATTSTHKPAIEAPQESKQGS